MTKILVDSADINAIKNISRYYNIAGITTNPTILSKLDIDLREQFKKIKNFIGDTYEIHIQTTEEDVDKIVFEAERLREYFGELFFIKIPISQKGLEAAKECRKRNIGVTMTAIFTTLQVVAAEKAGVNYVAPYVNRMENIGADSLVILNEMKSVLEGTNTNILAASFKNQKQVNDAIVLGVGSITIDDKLLVDSIWHPYTDKSILDFKKDWESKFNNRKVVDYL
ncbi:transaldolase [Gemella sp. GH3]|uniref:transaldolase family protein n=1 Tax=unclassified Gemella TaxID=2624949 RepID=UPI0015CFB942|nr:MULTISPECIES: transaldolase family protein [unclassified Gemella]MBF0713731.1 transaldolase [Gemella sp. GH3.1]NYS50683.1 transaldolase [Gemella sp. GH3]